MANLRNEGMSEYVADATTTETVEPVPAGTALIVWIALSVLGWAAIGGIIWALFA